MMSSRLLPLAACIGLMLLGATVVSAQDDPTPRKKTKSGPGFVPGGFGGRPAPDAKLSDGKGPEHPSLEGKLAKMRAPASSGRAIQLRVYMLELMAKTGPQPEPPGPEFGNLLGAADTLPAKLREAQRRGQIASLKQIDLAAVDGHSASSRLRDSRPYSLSLGGGRAAPGFGGGTQQSISYREMGTVVQVLPTLDAEGSVLVELTIEESRPLPSSAPPPAEGANFPRPEFATVQVETQVRVRSGQVALVQGTLSDSSPAPVHSLILLTATAEKADAPK
jgi:hypothetical protein